MQRPTAVATTQNHSLNRLIPTCIYHAPKDQLEQLTRPILLNAEARSQTNITLNPGYTSQSSENSNGKRSGTSSDLARKFSLLAKEACIVTCATSATCLFCSAEPSRIVNAFTHFSKKRKLTDIPPRPRTTNPQSLRILTMRVVMVHRRRPHQFESTLPFDLINQVWRHLPLRFLAAQRVARFYSPVLCTRVNTTASCHCPTEIWMYQSRVVMHQVVLCARCLGFDLASPVFKHILPCRTCEGPFARCGCLRMAHMRLRMHYDRQGNMVQIMLSSNHSGWKHLGHADLIGTGYLDGPVYWARDIVVYPNNLGCVFPPDMTFSKGTRLKEQTEQYLTTGRLLRLCWPTQVPKTTTAAAATPTKYIVEFPVPDLCIKKKAKRSGSHLFLETQAQLRKSRTVAVFVEAARLYMDILLKEQINVVLAGPGHMGHFNPSYRDKRGVDWPEAT